MKATLEKIAAPLAAALPDISAVPVRRQVVGAIVASALLHLLLFTTIALLAKLIPQPAEPPVAVQEEAQLEVEIVPAEEPEPETIIATQEVLPAIDRKGLEKSEEKPATARFQSDEDMIAGSERAGRGLEPLPTQEGRDLPFVDFKTQRGESTGDPKEVANAGSAAPPLPPVPSVPTPVPPLYKPKPLTKQYLEALERIEKNNSETPAKPDPAEKSAPVDPPPPPETTTRVEPAPPAPDQIPIATAPMATPAPRAPLPVIRPQPIPASEASPPSRAEAQEMARLVTPPPRPQPNRESGFTPDMQQTRIEGSISNRGRAGVDATRTPLGVYQRKVSRLIQSTWIQRAKPEMSALSLGTVRIRFFVTQDGKIEDLEVISNDSNKSFELICEQSVREAKIEPPPADLGVMKDGRLELVYSFTIFE